MFRQFDSAKLVLDQSVERPEDANDMAGALMRYATKGDAEQRVRRRLKSDAGKNISEDKLKMAFDEDPCRGARGCAPRCLLGCRD